MRPATKGHRPICHNYISRLHNNVRHLWFAVAHCFEIEFLKFSFCSVFRTICPLLLIVVVINFEFFSKISVNSKFNGD